MKRRELSAADQLVSIFAALADRTRLRLLNLLHGREVCVCYFVQVLGQSQPKISRHLAYLRRSGLVLARREGRWMHYRSNPALPQAAAALVQCVLGSLRNDPQFKRDLDQLTSTCCSPQRLVALQGAPLPTATKQ